jgi:general secretion pathway protein F
MQAVEKKSPTKEVTPSRRNFDKSNLRNDHDKNIQTEMIGRVRSRDLCRLTRQLATLLHAGMPLVPALSALVEQLQDVPNSKIPGLKTQQHPLAIITEQIRDDVSHGSTLAAALSKHPNVFSGIFVNTVAAGEAGGTLEDVLERLAKMLANRAKLTDKVKAALAYPIMMTIVATGVVVFLLSYVVPSITQIFLEMNRALPWPTRILISLSAFVKSYLMLIIIALFAVVAAFTAASRTKNGKRIIDRCRLRMPLFGKLLLKLEIARLTRTLGILLTSGIPILNALKIVKGVAKNSFIAAAVDNVQDMVARGDSIAAAISKTGLFPPIVFHIISTGQLSANLEDGFLNIADMYDDEVEMTSNTLTSLLEPAILLVMGAIVSFIVLAILLPIFEINQAI